MQWEVAFDIRPLFQERESQTDGDADLWSETFHHLAAKSVIRDFEQLAEKECEIEHGNVQLCSSRLRADPALPRGGLPSSFSSPSS